MSSEARSPHVLALVLCDAVHRDPVTGKNSLLGTFSTVTARSFPATHATMCAYVALTDGVGRQQIEFRLTPAGRTDAPIAAASFDLDFDDSRMTFEVVVRLTDVVVPAPGEYRIVLACGDEVLLERRMIARTVGKGVADA
jgi:hypothetical protein